MSVTAPLRHPSVTEEVTAFDLPVIGDLPLELNGRYLRNGPNPIDEVDPSAHHWFSGDGMVHGIRIREGKAEWYRNRYVGSTSVSASRGTPDIPGPNWNGSGNGPNTNVGGFAGTTWAMVESGGCLNEFLSDSTETGYPTAFNLQARTVRAFCRPKLKCVRDLDSTDIHQVVRGCPHSRPHLFATSCIRWNNSWLALFVVRFRSRRVNKHRHCAGLLATSLHGSWRRHGRLGVSHDPNCSRTTERGFCVGVGISGSIPLTVVHSRHRNVTRAWLPDACALQHSIRSRVGNPTRSAQTEQIVLSHA